MIGGRGGAFAAVAIALFTAAGLPRAAVDVPGEPEGPLRVALLSTTPDDPLAGRLDAELGTIGFDVARSVVSPTAGIEEQVRAALSGGARAVIVADGHRTDVWIAQAGSSRVGLRQELEVDETSGQQAILALRTVEFLRISLGLVSGPAVQPLAPTPVVSRRPPPPPPPRRWLTVDATAGALAGGGGGGGTIAIAGVGVRAQLLGMVGAELCLYAPLTDAALSDVPSPVRTSVWMAGGGVLLAPRPDRRLSVEVAAGALAALVRASGTTASSGGITQYQGGTDQAVSPAFYGRGAARLRLVPQLALRIDLFGGALVAAPAFGVAKGTPAQSAVGTWGPAFAAGLGGAELSF
ncbi:MAG TPA: hypothetical protein VKZ18_03920 [Polyangia bacterium]|nr:hypothetical protein [Polyangia bacterium]